jgi:ComF family protein
VSFFYPPVCQLCGEVRATPEAGFVCTQCRSRPGAIRIIQPPYCEVCGLPFEGEITGRFRCRHCADLKFAFGRARAAVVATEMVLDVMHRYKYRQALWFEPFLAELLVREAAPDVRAGGWDCLAAVPLFPAREREREFNQSVRLARCLSRATGVALAEGVVRRRRATRTQTQLSRAERTANMRDAFVPVTQGRLRGARVVLVDDVLTTGATTSACAAALRAAGAAEVCVWTVARGLWQT